MRVGLNVELEGTRCLLYNDGFEGEGFRAGTNGGLCGVAWRICA